MKYYQPIYKIENKWTNLDEYYFTDFDKAKNHIENKSMFINCSQLGLDVFDPAKDDYLPMFWEYKDNQWIRNYKD